METIVIIMEGGIVQQIISNKTIPVKVLICNSDIEGVDEDILITDKGGDTFTLDEANVDHIPDIIYEYKTYLKKQI